MQEGLISIITPCYNTGKYIHRLLDSVLLQDYPKIEMLVINDGSTDNSEEIIRYYIPRFQQKGYALEYKYQPNQGQSAAINNGLKWVRGEYLIWPDSDDYYNDSRALSMMVEALRNSDDNYGIVRCLPQYVNEKDFQPLLLNREYDMSSDQFDNCLFGTHFFWGAGNYMVQMKKFLDVNPQREIYTEKDAGQNWQMLLPVLYRFKCLTLNNSFLNILEREDSHSRGLYRTYNQIIEKLSSYERTIIATLNKMDFIPEKQRDLYLRKIAIAYLRDKLHYSLIENRGNDLYTYYKKLKDLGTNIDLKTKIIALSTRIPIIYDIINVVRKIK